MASLIMLVAWELWNERNGRIFNNKFVPSSIAMSRIRCEAKNWGLAGATHLCNIIYLPSGAKEIFLTLS